jgi:hypothetical protein
MARYPRLEVRSSCGGRGVFTCEALGAGRRLLRFAGVAVDAAFVAASAAADGHDDFLQVGAGRYLGYSGTADDWINHACDPNCYVAVTRRGVFLVALVDIAAGAEVTFDYGLTQVDFPFRFHCLCGSEQCRGEIGNYDEMPPMLLARYRALGAVPAYVAAVAAAPGVSGARGAAGSR